MDSIQYDIEISLDQASGLSTPCNGFSANLVHAQPEEIFEMFKLSTPCNGFACRRNSSTRRTAIRLSTPCNGFKKDLGSGVGTAQSYWAGFQLHVMDSQYLFLLFCNDLFFQLHVMDSTK